MSKDALHGYGHWHVFLTRPDERAPAGEMATLMAMGCDQTFAVSTAGLQRGAIYTLVVELTDNNHAPLSPRVFDEIQVRVD